MYKQLIALAVILTCSVYGSDSAPVKAQKMFEDFVSGKFIQPSSPEVMGWIMEGPDGKMISRTILNHQADQVALLGIDAFPVILEKLEHKDMHVRYIAATALRKISGEDPLWYTFGIPLLPVSGVAIALTFATRWACSTIHIAKLPLM